MANEKHMLKVVRYFCCCTTLTAPSRNFTIDYTKVTCAYYTVMVAILFSENSSRTELATGCPDY